MPRRTATTSAWRDKATCAHPPYATRDNLWYPPNATPPNVETA